MRQILLVDSLTLNALTKHVNKKIVDLNMWNVSDININKIDDRWVATIIYEASFKELRSDNDVRG